MLLYITAYDEIIMQVYVRAWRLVSLSIFLSIFIFRLCLVALVDASTCSILMIHLCVSVCERERESVCVCVRVCVCERGCVCVSP